MKTLLLAAIFLWAIVVHAAEPVPATGPKSAEKKAPARLTEDQKRQLLEKLDKRLREDKEKEQTKIRERRARIVVEIRTLGDHPWAGEYFTGGRLATTHVSLAPKTGFLGIFQSDLVGPVSAFGPIEEKGGRLRLSGSRPLRDIWGLANELVPIAWGERKYLVPSEKLVDFCNQVNEGREPRRRIYGFCLLRIGDEKKKVVGLPSVPKPVEKYLLAKPIDTVITSVGKPVSEEGQGDVTAVGIRVTLKDGSKAGLLPGMTLHHGEPDGIGDVSFVLDKVEHDRSEAVLTRYVHKGAWGVLTEVVEKDPTVGWKVSTRDEAWVRINREADRDDR
jgi:hypothetical protein